MKLVFSILCFKLSDCIKQSNIFLLLAKMHIFSVKSKPY